MRGHIVLGATLLTVCAPAVAEPISAIVAPLLLGGLGVLPGMAIASAMSKKSAPQAPQVKPPAVMPTPDDDAAVAARRRQIAMMQARGGRASTILTDPDDKLGG